MTAEYAFPEYYQFPPFFTLQPIRETQEKQIKLWSKLILGWHESNNDPILIVNESKLFTNTELPRTLSSDGIRAVLRHMIETGHAEWDDEGQTRCRLYWKIPAEWGAEIYAFAKERGMLNNVYTVYELHAGEETQGTAFHGLESWLVVRALESLENEGKAQIFQGETSDEYGVKFLDVDI